MTSAITFSKTTITRRMLIHLTIGYLLLQNTAALYLYDWKPMAGYTYTLEPVSPLTFAIKGDCKINLRAKIYLGDVAALEFYSTQAIDICCKGSTANNWYDCRLEKQSWILPPCSDEQIITMTLSNTNLQIDIEGTQVLNYKFSLNDGKCQNTKPGYIITTNWSSNHLIAIAVIKFRGLWLCFTISECFLITGIL